MSRSEDDVKTVPLTREVYAYLVAQAEPPSPVQEQLVARTRTLGGPAQMRIPHEQAVFLTMLGKLLGARRIVEVGTFTGYSTLALAEGLVPGGRLLTCDISEEWTSIAQEAWKEAGVADRIELKIAPALETLRALPPEPVIDLVFLDADKPGYQAYWDQLVPRVRPGGLLLADNVLYGGEAVRADAEGNALAIREFNAHVRSDDRVESVLLPIADGLTLARKR
ncbi:MULTISPECIES: O-methyltransferase [unclassified Streptomyces]|uniref:O-methyltransferase n=1 Tax=unclassified Streptomyces TaxID=2593676 RepID=UPI001BEC01BD|nr:MULTISPECIES: O-methyltransferase [unclassified Streptomyces]MBT2407710.1 class I SAM-dependent methyltransferase [Streptomyces sp. ISL-21]MBT2610840.1 class I SAM-dependent methyltransferase [Streptomyces sp. ISL-87]